MGIPKLFRHLSQNYMRILRKTNPSRSNVEWLGIDFNSLMHPVCATIAATQETKQWKSQKNWPILHRAILDELKKVLTQFSTSGNLKTVMIAIDGVVPMAKIVQQRQRRFRSSYERQGVKTNWDSCLISPGTYFMQQFEKFFHEHVKEILQISAYKDLNIIVSDSRKFGEGEHKIMTEIRKLKDNTPIAIYGLDADLIILAITALQKHKDVYLYRENVHCAVKEFEKEDHLLMDIPQLWKSICDEIMKGIEDQQEKMRKSGLEPAKFDIDFTRIMYDFILLTCYFGNDFLPPIPSMSLSLEDSIWKLIDTYSMVVAEEGNYMCQPVTDKVFHWNQTFLIKLWSLCQKDEDKRMKLRTIQWTRRRRSHKAAESSTVKEPIEIFYSFPQKKQNWIKYSLGSSQKYLDVFSDKDFNYQHQSIQQSMVKEWLRGSIWVLSYYLGKPIDTFWWYPWTPPPCFDHLINYSAACLAESTQVECIQSYLSLSRRKRMKRPDLYLQLMCIIPPDSEYCVSAKKMGWYNASHPRNLFTFREIWNMKQSIAWASWSHEAIPILPLIELPYIVHSLRH